MNLSIIAEGGAMRGAYVLGVIDALYSYFGLKHVDSLTGSSASASTLSYYASDQFYPGYYIWTGEATNPRFLSIGNLFKGRPFLDIDYMVDEVFKKKIPLDPDKINKSKMHLVIPLTNAKTGKAEYFDSKTNEDIFEILRAAMAAPFVYGKFVKIRSKVYFDGSFSDPFPIDIPRIKDSRKIIILTKPSNNSKKTNTERVLLTMLQWKMKKGVYNALKDGYSIYNKKIDKITELKSREIL